MYSKQEESVLRKTFWTSFGQYLAPIPSANGNKINWINYKTGIRHINFKMDTLNDHAYIGVELSHPDLAKQEMYFDHFKALNQQIKDGMGEEWIWENQVVINEKIISRIYQTLPQVNVYRQEDWPQMISFLKTRIILLDRFWVTHKEVFEMIA